MDTFVNSLNRRLDAPTKTHLKKVYSTLTISALSAYLGGYAFLYTGLANVIGGFLNLIITAGLLIAFYSTPDNGKNQSTRLGYLLGFAFFSGFGTGPIIEHSLYIDGNIIPTALLSTAFIFACFSISSIYSDRLQNLYLGGFLMSGLSILFYMALLNIFFQSYMIFKFYVYMSLALMCGFVMYDTALIIEKRRRGDTDYISHSVLLFMDLLSIFRNLVILLTDKERQNKKKRN